MDHLGDAVRVRVWAQVADGAEEFTGPHVDVDKSALPGMPRSGTGPGSLRDVTEKG